MKRGNTIDPNPTGRQLTPTELRIISVLNGNGTSLEGSPGISIQGDPDNPYYLMLVEMGFMSGPHYESNHENSRPHFRLTDKGRAAGANLEAYA